MLNIGRKREPAHITTLAKKIQAQAKWAGAYDVVRDSIELGCIEDDVPIVLFHEEMHRWLFHNISLEATFQWDEIAERIEKWIFGKTVNTTFIQTLPAFRAKPDPVYFQKWLKGTVKQERQERKEKREKRPKPKKFKEIHRRFLKRFADKQ